jgi:hypothetical protein
MIPGSNFSSRTRAGNKLFWFFCCTIPELDFSGPIRQMDQQVCTHWSSQLDDFQPLSDKNAANRHGQGDYGYLIANPKGFAHRTRIQATAQAAKPPPMPHAKTTKAKV